MTLGHDDMRIRVEVEFRGKRHIFDKYICDADGIHFGPVLLLKEELAEANRMIGQEIGDE